ncbi:MAG: hypothetical protein JXO51_00220 [Candidatus Aminicenantes bacterium]|nr:hypothetical protein [Candidatus Aminicenantes bacterium]
MRLQSERRWPGRAVLAILLLMAGMPPLVAAGALPLGTLTYREVEGNDIATHLLFVRPDGDGLQIELSTARGEAVVRQTFLVASDLVTRAWTFSDPARRMKLAASVQGKHIVLSGSFQGRKIDKRFDADGPPWNQLFQMGLGPFVLAGKKSMAFRSVGTQGPGELKIGKMTVTRREDETIELGGGKIAAVHLRISLSGLLAIFWHGDYWYRRSDGRFLRYRGRNRKGGPIAVAELVGEEPGDAR